MSKEEKCARESYYYEMDTDSRIAFLAREMQRTQRELATALILIDKLMSHSHCDGKIVVEVKQQSILDEPYRIFRQYEHWSIGR